LKTRSVYRDTGGADFAFVFHASVDIQEARQTKDTSFFLLGKMFDLDLPDVPFLDRVRGFRKFPVLEDRGLFMV